MCRAEERSFSAVLGLMGEIPSSQKLTEQCERDHLSKMIEMKEKNWTIEKRNEQIRNRTKCTVHLMRK